jgi:hypothetical protein
MGNGEWLMMTASLERAEQSDEKPQRSFRELDDRVRVRFVNQTQVPGYFEMTMQLSRRPEGNSQTTDELGRRSEGIAFDHVRRDRRRGPPDLIGQTEVLAEWPAEGQAIRRSRELLSAFPRLERFELLHAGSIGGSGIGVPTQRLRAMLKSARTIPHSPFPIRP